jgi:hypothetical protein
MLNVLPVPPILFVLYIKLKPFIVNLAYKFVTVVNCHVPVVEIGVALFESEYQPLNV